MIREAALAIALLMFFNHLSYSQPGTERRNQYLQDALKIIIPQKIQKNTRRVSDKDSTWADWLTRTGELPPDFSKMRSHPFLPDPLLLEKDGKDLPVTTTQQWEEKRNWIKREYQQWISGRFPPSPNNILPEILSEKTEDGTLVQLIRLKFGPGHKAIMTFELMIPQDRKGPLPVYMTQGTHRGWAQLAVRRGYIGCVYAGADTWDDTEDYKFVYPEYDFSMLMRRAWGASRVIDYLYTRKEIDKKQIAITGHSRNGKQSLWAAAFDDRIAAVISSSSSTGGDSPWRYNDPQYASETIDLVTAYNSHWFHPRLRFFFGHEDKLPVDQNLLAALIAPRALLFQYSIYETGLNSWSIEQNYYSVKRVYDFYKTPNNIGVATRMGRHAVAARDVENAIDFLDFYFKRRAGNWNNAFYFPYDYNGWLKNNASVAITAKKIEPVVLKDDYRGRNALADDRIKIKDNLKWLLGDQPAGVKASPPAVLDPARTDWMRSATMKLPEIKGAKMVEFGPYEAIGDYMYSTLYLPEQFAKDLSGKKKIPVVIYLHQYAHSSGFVKGYDKNNEIGKQKLISNFIKQGFAVYAFDMFGFGTRLEEATHFYERFPSWSKMGRMVMDVSSSIDALQTLDYVDPKNIFVFGNSIGGSVGLMSAALDDRIAGVGVVAAISPFRTSNDRYETIRTLSHLFGMIPRLGLFADIPQRVPVDYGEVLAMIAPRPVMIIAPDMDWHTDMVSLRKMLDRVNNVYKVYEKPEALDLRYPHDINRMPEDLIPEVGGFFLKHRAK
jgi:pimeloyl-ACP methyl ester carboxylesterase